MSQPTVNMNKTVAWCAACAVTRTDPAWAARHHQATGHQTYRRSWKLETWHAAENPTEKGPAA